MARPMVISGPSGVGKSTLLQRLLKEYPGQFEFSVSHTTRLKRDKEVDGKHYHFVSRDEFEKEIRAGLFIEYTEYAGNLYGTSINAVELVRKSGKICILDIDSEGVKNIKKTDMNPIYIYIEPPSLEELELRLKKRGSEDDIVILERLKIAQREMEFADLPGMFDVKIVNADLELAYKQLTQAIFGKVQPLTTQ